MTHHETSVGLLNPVREVGAICHKYDGLMLVDSVSSLGAEDLAGVRLGRGGGSGVGTGGMASKVAAARIAAAAGIRAVVASATAVGALLAGEPVGTSFAPAPSRMPTRLLWLAYAATSRGRNGLVTR